MSRWTGRYGLDSSVPWALGQPQAQAQVCPSAYFPQHGFFGQEPAAPQWPVSETPLKQHAWNTHKPAEFQQVPQHEVRKIGDAPIPPARAMKSSLQSLRADAPTFSPGATAFEIRTPPRRRRETEERETEEPLTSEKTLSKLKEERSLPAVVSVRKSNRGCAVVLLRDQRVIELALRQTVAVIDGICVEVRKHADKRTGECKELFDDACGGLFVAWGSRVEKKVTVSSEGMEAHFNALARLAMKENVDLDPRPPFAEACQRFVLECVPGPLPHLERNVQPDVADSVQLLTGTICRPDLVEDLWKAKTRMDDMWKIPPPPLARSLMARVARAQLFPHSGEGGKEHENRAGDKLAELCSATGVLDDLPADSAFLDLCGGPGAWSQHILENAAVRLRGFGLTLREDVGAQGDWRAQGKDQWYPDLMRNHRWAPLWGSDGSGDLLRPSTVKHTTRRLARENVLLVAADGGFSDRAIPANLLELYFYRLFLAEILMAANCLRDGGRFVCKLYTTFSPATSALLYLSTRLFERVEIVKPMSSRTTGPERYLVCFGFRASGSQSSQIRATLARAHEAGSGSSPLSLPLLTPCVSKEDLAADVLFQKTIMNMTEALCERQAKALTAVVDRAQFLEDMAMTVSKEVSEESTTDTGSAVRGEDDCSSSNEGHGEIFAPSRRVEGRGEIRER